MTRGEVCRTIGRANQVLGCFPPVAQSTSGKFCIANIAIIPSLLLLLRCCQRLLSAQMIAGTSMGSMGESTGAAGGSENTVLVDGKLLSGDVLLELARNKGLCHKCLQTVTHRRIRKKFGISRGWEPITVTDTVAGNYTVYKGFCLQPTCWTLEEAQIVLGEKKAKKSKTSRRVSTSAQSQPRPSHRHNRRSCISASPSSTSTVGSGDSTHSTLRRAQTFIEEGSPDRRSRPQPHSKDERATSMYQLPYIDETRIIEDSARRFGNTLVGGPSFSSRSSGTSTASERSVDQSHRKTKALELGTLLDAQSDASFRGRSSPDTVSFRSREGEDLHMARKRASIAVPARKKPNEQVSTSRRRRISIHAGFEPVSSPSTPAREGSARRHSGSFSCRDGASTPTILELIRQNALETGESGSNHHKKPSPRSSPAEVPSPEKTNDALQYQNLRTSFHGVGRTTSEELPSTSSHSTGSAQSLASSSHDNRGTVGFSRSEGLMGNKNKILERLMEVHSVEKIDEGQAELLWKTLNEVYKRSPGLNPKLAPLKTLLHIFEQERSAGETYKLGWQLLAQIMVSPQEVLTDYNMAQNLFRAIVKAFDTDIDTGGSANLQCATQTLFALFEVHGDVAASVVSSMIHVLDRSKRLQWSAALLDNLLTADTESDFFAEALFVLNTLLSLRASGMDSGMISPEEEMMMLTMLVGFVVSVLSGYERDGAKLDRFEVLKSNSAISLLSYIASRAGASAISDRQYECIAVVCETIERHLDDAELLAEGSRALSALLPIAKAGEDKVDSNSCKNAVVLLEKLMFAESYGQGAHIKSLVKQLLGLVLISPDKQLMELLANSAIPKQLIRMIEDSNLSVEASALAFHIAHHQPVIFQQDPEFLSIMEAALVKQNILTDTKANICKLIASLISRSAHWLEWESSIVQSLIHVLDAEEESAELMREAQRALSAIVAALPEQKFQHQSSFLIDAAVSIIQSKEDPLRVASGFIFLSSLLARSDCGENCTSEQMISATVVSMELHFCSIEVVTACCQVLRLLVAYRDHMAVIARTGVSRLVINAIMIYPTSKDFLLEAMAILDIFASEPSFRATFDDAEAEAAITSLLAASQYKPEVLAVAFGTLNSIVKYSPVPSGAPPMQAVVLNCIVVAMKTYPGNEDVSQHSLKLLQTYTYNEESLSMMRQESALLVPILSNSSALSSDTCEKARFIMSRLYNQYNGFATRESRTSPGRSA